MTDVTVNDNLTLDAANKASNHLKIVEEVLLNVERLITLAEQQCDLEIDTGQLEELQANVVTNADAINQAIAKYEGDCMHSEGLETTGRV